MKKLLILLAIAGFCWAACKKSKSSFSYTVNNIADVTISNDTTILLPIQVSLLGGNQETVTLAFSGLPSGVTVTPSSANGIPTFTETFSLTSLHAAVGTYTVTVTSSSASTGSKSYKFNLNITPVANCAARFIGSYTGNDSCTSGNYPYTAIITPASSTSVSISNFGGFGASVSVAMSVDCNTDAVVIAKQKIQNGTWLRGSGVFSGTSLTIRYAILDTFGVVTDTCSSRLIR